MAAQNRPPTAARWFTPVAIHVLVATSGFAQVHGLPVNPLEGPSVAPPAIQRSSLYPPVALRPGELPPVQGKPVSPPNPTAEERPTLEPHPAPPCDDPFRFCTAGGSTHTGLPRTLLWEPALAAPREPRFQVMPTTLSNASTQRTIETAIGGTLGLVRVEPAGWKSSLQLDLFAVANSRFSQRNYLIDTDYRYGFPITISRGPWHGKFGYEHTSSHLGDEYGTMSGQKPFDYIRDEVVVGVGRWLLDSRVRVYGQAGWGVSQKIPGNPSPFRFDLGAEWRGKPATGCWGKPFGAANVRFDGAADYDPSLTLQLGWQWRDPARRLAQVRIFGEYFTGHSPYGQFFQTRENWFGLGFAADF